MVKRGSPNKKLLDEITRLKKETTYSIHISLIIAGLAISLGCYSLGIALPSDNWIIAGHIILAATVIFFVISLYKKK